MSLTPEQAQGLINAITNLSAQVGDIGQRLQNLESGIGGAGVGGFAGMAVPVQYNQQAVQTGMLPGGNGFNDHASYFVRIKPYNKNAGQVRRTQFFNEIGRVLRGGTGMPGDIPEWLEVPGSIARALSVYRQRPELPVSPPVLDIATHAEKEQIDRAEESQRNAMLGVGAPAPQRLSNPGMVQAQVRSLNPVAARPEALRTVPSMVTGAEVYQQPVAPSMAGRMQALEGLTAVPVPPGVSPAMMVTPVTVAAAAPPAPVAMPAPQPPITATVQYQPGAMEPGMDLTVEARSPSVAQAIQDVSKYPLGTVTSR